MISAGSLNGTNIIESELKGDLQKITLSLLQHRIENLRDTILSDEDHPPINNETFKSAAQSTMEIAPKMDEVEKLFCPGRNEKVAADEEKKRVLSKTPAQIRHDLLVIFKKYDEPNDELKKELTDYYTEYNNRVKVASPVVPYGETPKGTGKSEEQLKKQFEEKLKQALETKRSTSFWSRTYTTLEADFFEQYANRYSSQATCDLYRKQHDEKKAALQQLITDIASEIKSTKITDPFITLRSIYAEFASALSSTSSRYEQTTLKGSVEDKITDLKQACTDIVLDYKNQIHKVETEITAFPDKKLIAALNNTLRTKKDDERETALRDQLAAHRKRLNTTVRTLNDKLKTELRFNEAKIPDSQIKTILENENTFKVYIETKMLASDAAAVKEIQTLYGQTKSAEVTFNSTYQKKVDFVTRLKNILTNEIPRYLKDQAMIDDNVGQHNLAELSASLSKLHDTVFRMGMVEAAKALSHLKKTHSFNPNNEFDAGAAQTSAREAAEEVASTLRQACDTTYSACVEKFQPLQDLINHEAGVVPDSPKKWDWKAHRKEEIAGLVLKDNTESQKDIFRRAITALQPRIESEIKQYTRQIYDIHEKEVKRLQMKGEADVRLEWKSTLAAEYKRQITELKTSLETKQLITVFQESEKQDEALITRLLAETRAAETKAKEERAAKQNAAANEKFAEHFTDMAKAARGQGRKSFAWVQHQSISAELKADSAQHDYQAAHTAALLSSSQIATAIRSKPEGSALKTFLAIVIPFYGWWVGGKDIYKEVKHRTNSSVLAALSGFFGSIYSWVRGVYVNWTGKSYTPTSNASLSFEEVPLLESFQPTTSASPHSASTTRQLLSLQQLTVPVTPPPSPCSRFDFSTYHTCIETIDNRKSDEKKLIFSTKPKKLYLDNDDSLYLQRGDKSDENDLRFRTEAKNLMLRILRLIENRNDLKINLDGAFIQIEITDRVDGTEQKNIYKINPTASNIDNVLWGQENQSGAPGIFALNRLQFATDNDLEILLYPSKYRASSPAVRPVSPAVPDSPLMLTLPPPLARRRSHSSV